MPATSQLLQEVHVDPTGPHVMGECNQTMLLLGTWVYEAILVPFGAKRIHTLIRKYILASLLITGQTSAHTRYWCSQRPAGYRAGGERPHQTKEEATGQKEGRHGGCCEIFRGARYLLLIPGGLAVSTFPTYLPPAQACSALN